ncbi:MAG: energy transducer TonB [Ferruginibacter sp.]|nr:energy transducer TonB [Ferruginibacter sp.]
MNRNTILKSDVLDIIFEKRNKSYGAYTLRKFYPNRLKLALGFVFLAAIAFSAFAFVPKKDNKVSAKPYTFKEIEIKKVQDKPKEPEKKKEMVKAEKKTEIKAVPVNQVKLTSNVKIVAKGEKADSIRIIKPTDEIGSTNISIATPGQVFVEPVKPVGESGGGGQTDLPEIDKISPMEGDAVEVLPSYPGGMDALRKFLQKNLQTPDELQSGETVSVRVKFVVDYTGKLKSFETVRNDAYNAEVVRVLKKMPEWIPGKTKGENVSVYYVIPVKFESTD